MTPKEMIELLKSRVPGQKIANFIIKNPRAGIGWQAPLKLAESHLVLIERMSELATELRQLRTARDRMAADEGITTIEVKLMDGSMISGYGVVVAPGQDGEGESLVTCCPHGVEWDDANYCRACILDGQRGKGEL